MSIGISAITIQSHLLGSRLRRTVLIPSLTFSIAFGSGVPIRRLTQADLSARSSRAGQEDTQKSKQKGLSLEEIAEKKDAEARPYQDDSLKELVKRVPELKGMHSAADRGPLAAILKKTGEKVDEFFENAVDLVAEENIKQERLGSSGFARAFEPVKDNYLILREGSEKGADFDEFRMDENGKRLEQVGIRRGFLVTSGFALICVQFSTALQPESRFRYLGEQKLTGHEAYVVAFAQQPGKASQTVVMMTPDGGIIHMMTQGVAWVDQKDFHILQIRTDLLARHPEIGLEEQTTKVDFTEVRFTDVATPLWLPRDVTVYLKLGRFQDRPFDEAFRNVHHYTNYRRYRVAVKMVAPQ